MSPVSHVRGGGPTHKHIPRNKNPNSKRHRNLSVHHSPLYNSKQPRCPSTDELIEKIGYMYTAEYCSAMKKNKAASFPEMWRDLASVMHSEVSHKEENKYCLWRHTYGIEKDGADEPICKAETGAGLQNWLVDTGGEQGGGMTLCWFCTHFSAYSSLFTNSRSVENKNFWQSAFKKKTTYIVAWGNLDWIDFNENEVLSPNAVICK